MSTIDKVVALLEVLRPDDVQALPPAKRQSFAQTCRHLADIADAPVNKVPTVGVLAQLRQERAQ